ncbi:Predicted protein [Taphrina deformans PYCC 5710]|uniref:Uncharacterized protein n=1 Tax=Taphrina deformans (strain PYCC 5710 / ATCC 11124 / CBS 356.35 / IMI 108563 / JCM 9778 / NBRC 8474) TaxID=1097556 RepID=R4XA55_TAPDE|nr:Predicted protein [Taphrina deformans PYCC 5710]|eukprot:CCG82402.1 Predicted protein [Taphrina deformans PYCC 5710]
MEISSVNEILSWLSNGQAGFGSDQDMESKLRSLKELTRNKQNAEPLYTSSSFSLLYKFAFAAAPESLVAADEAKRCLANALTLEDRCVPIFLHTNGFDSMFKLGSSTIGNCSFQDEFLYARIMFLVTGKRGASIRDDLEKYRIPLTQILGQWLARHWLQIQDEQTNQSPDMDTSPRHTALMETLKLCFNISLFHPQVLKSAFPIEGYEDSESLLLAVITHLRKCPAHGAWAAIPHSVNLLTTVGNTQNNTKKASTYTAVFQLLYEYVDAMLEKTQWHTIQIADDHIIPLLTVISNIYLSYEADQEAQDYIKALFLIPSAERAVPLGRSNSSQAKILQLMNSSGPQTRDSISTFLYQVSDSDPKQFVENVGYGYAIGFLTSKGIALAPDDLPAECDGRAINPVTGQDIEAEEYEQAQRGLSEMTEEEKEIEAERLFVLFERLEKNDIINVKNPIQQAVDEGRFQEM